MSYIGADFVADALASLGVEHVFAIVSIHNMPLLDAINRLGKTKIIDVRHEQAGTHAADGYARATGKMGVMIASTGPGTSNTVTGLYESQFGSSRVLVITGQADTTFYGKGLSYVHEAEKQIQMLSSVCRRVESPRHISQLADSFQAVVSDIFTGRPRAPSYTGSGPWAPYLGPTVPTHSDLCAIHLPWKTSHLWCSSVTQRWSLRYSFN